MNKKEQKTCEQNQIDSAAEAVVEIVKTNSTIGIILAFGFSAACIAAAILAIIYGANWVNEKKPAQPTYTVPNFDNYRPN
jgi:hypothetical protein